jgi:uncharacterized protein YajQ (UPF0234 family)
MLGLLRYYGHSLALFLRIPVLRVLLIATVVVLAFGTVFYHFTEGWSWVDSVYFCTITLATIGYGDFAPTKDYTKLFTIAYVFVGLSIVATFITTLLKAPLLVEPPHGEDARRAILRESALSAGLGPPPGMGYSMTMPKTESFDISTGVDLQEVDNALNQTRQELQHRFDFKNVLAEINFDRPGAKLTIHTADDFKLESIWQVMEQRFRARKVPLKNLQRGNVEKAAGSSVRQEVKLAQSIDTDTARKIVKYVKDKGYKKVQTQIQGDEVRVSAPSRDDLQAVIKDLREEDWGIELKFGNYRS